MNENIDTLSATIETIDIKNYLLKLAPEISIFNMFEKYYYQNDFNPNLSGIFIMEANDNDTEKDIDTSFYRGIFMIRNETPPTDLVLSDVAFKFTNTDNIFGIKSPDKNRFFFIESNDEKEDGTIKITLPVNHSLWGIAF